jgi:MoaA/NifB/PqqE/SkfB family radical SAM enzyme
MPWIHLHVSNHGQVNACCVANIPFGNVNDQDFDEIWQGKEIDQLRSKFAAGIPDPRCAVCLKREQGGASSIRLETFQKFGRQIPDNYEFPRYFDIRFSNVCNFRCRTCWHGASSKWFNDAQALGRTASKKAIIENIKDLDHFLAKFGPALQHAEEIYFAGGEPLVTAAHYLLLEWLIDHNVSPRLRYNTNFSKLSFKQWDVLKLWEKFETVEVLASIDGMGEKGEIIRKEFHWETFLKNRRRLMSSSPHMSFKLAPTVSILNVFDLPDFYQFSVKQKLIDQNDWYINLLERPFYYNIQALPLEKKERLASLYNAFLRENEPQLLVSVYRNFESVVEFMWSEDLSNHYPAFLKETKKIDELRKEYLLSSYLKDD